MPDQFQYIKLPDGSYGKFAANASDDQIRSSILKDFPDAFKRESNPVSLSNPHGEGTYAMWNDRGQLQHVPYSNVELARGAGWKFDTNPSANGTYFGDTSHSGLTPQQQYEKDKAYADRGAPRGVQALTGIAKGGMTLTSPFRNALELTVPKEERTTPEKSSRILSATTPTERIAKGATISAPIVASGIAAPIATAGGLLGGTVGGIGAKKLAEASGADPWQSEVAGDVGGLIGGISGGLAGNRASLGARALAQGNPDAAALRGMRIGPASPKAIPTLNSLEGARPFLKGASSLEDLQARISQAKKEIWSPYKEATESLWDTRVPGPDGEPTTIGALESERSQLSALNRQLRTGNPEALQIAKQKGMTQAELLDRENAVKGALDARLQESGIDPGAIRKAFGQVSAIERRVGGKSTLAENETPFGFGRMLNLKINRPSTWLEEPAQGLRDIFAGRPLWSGKPTDINIREGFSTGGEKPFFGEFNPQAEITGPKPLFSFDTGIVNPGKVVAHPDVMPKWSPRRDPFMPSKKQ